MDNIDREIEFLLEELKLSIQQDPTETILNPSTRDPWETADVNQVEGDAGNIRDIISDLVEKSSGRVIIEITVFEYSIGSSQNSISIQMLKLLDNGDREIVGEHIYKTPLPRKVARRVKETSQYKSFIHLYGI